MCFMVSCPYVPPHEFNLDSPHLMLRYRAAERKRDGADFRVEQLTKTDRNGRLARLAPRLVNWAGATRHNLTRPVLSASACLHREAEHPQIPAKTFSHPHTPHRPAPYPEAP